MFSVGDKVRSLVEFSLVPKGTTGTIVEDYGTGLTVRWDLDFSFKPLEDGFDKQRDLQFLELVHGRH